MRGWLRVAALAGGGLVLAATVSAGAADFSHATGSEGRAMVFIQGAIVPGDAAKLQALIASLPQGERVAIVALNSPGGLVSETVRVVGLLKQPWVAMVPAGGTCASACTLIFGAAAGRAAAVDARIGVHRGTPARGYEGYAERIDADGEMVKLAVRMGLPGPIIDKMQRTPPDQIDWLTEADLRLWNVARLPAR